MKSHKLLLNALLTFVPIALVFLVSAPIGYAQTDQDWSEPVNLSFSGAASNPVMVVDLRGTIHVIWLDDIDGYKYSQSDDGVTWSRARTVNFPFRSKDSLPMLLADANGSIHIFWISSTQGLFYGQTTPFDFSNPGNWKTISLLAGDVMGYDVVLDARGALHITYVTNSATDANPAGVYYRQSIVGGGSWYEASMLYESEYFRSAKQNDVYVRISSSNSLSNQRIFVTWDNRAQKRVFMAVSEDSGLTWGGAQQIKGPEDTGGIDTPFNLTVSALGENVLLIWQGGEPGLSNCTIYSQWSDDGGVTWGDTMEVLGGRSECPLSTKVIGRDSNTMSVMFVGQVSPIMVAWNGRQWSNAQIQTQLPSMLNPLTYDAILLGCRFDLINKGRLFVAGCDQGRSGDVWFLSRSLEPVENWFVPSITWGEPDVLSVRSEKPQRISNFYSAPDDAGNIHAVWVQSPIGQGNGSDITIEYARWDGRQWSPPVSVIPFLGSIPVQVVLAEDSLERLLLTWIDGYNGDLVFSWANLDRANLASEWMEGTNLPVPSRLINSSDVVVDGSGRITNAYVVPINEERGIYVVQSSDNGKSWSLPVRVFDAVAEGWERIENPRISLSSNGVLHLIFIRDTVRVGQPVGLYYSRSLDGGNTWSDVQILSEGQIQWADIAAYGEQTIHVVWQEYDGLVFANISQFSPDSGVTWGKQNNVTGVNEDPTCVSLASDGRGLLHFIQLVGKTNVDAYFLRDFVLQDWKWDGMGWNLELTQGLVIKGEETTCSLSVDITTTGFLGVFIPVEYTGTDKSIKSEVWTFSRYLEDAGNGQQSVVPILPTTIAESGGEDVSILQPTSTPDLSVVYDDKVSKSPLLRNIAGIVLIGVAVFATLFLLLWRRPAKK